MLGEAGGSPESTSSDDETKPMLQKSPSVDGFYIGDHPTDSYSCSDAPSDDYLSANEAKMQFHDPLTRVRNVFNERRRSFLCKLMKNTKSSAPPNNLLY